MGLSVDWDLARRIAARTAPDDPRAGTDLARALDAEFAAITPDAEAMVAAETGLHSLAGPARAQTADRMDWVDANLASFGRMTKKLIDKLEDGEDEPGPFSRLVEPLGVGPKVAGAEVGLLLGWMSGRVLGQYDLLIAEDDEPDAQDWVYYVGPNILGLEQRYGFPRSEFRLWIALHECTHRAQFTGVPWMRAHFLSLVDELIDSVDPDPGRFVEALKSMAAERKQGKPSRLDDGGLSAVFASPEQRATMEKITGLMSLLEGHGDITMNRAGADLIPSQDRFSRVLSQRRQNAPPITKFVQKLIGLEAKMNQYAQGEHFVLEVERAGGRELFDRVWDAPEHLPTVTEIREPSLWVDRMREPAAA